VIAFDPAVSPMRRPETAFGIDRGAVGEAFFLARNVDEDARVRRGAGRRVEFIGLDFPGETVGVIHGLAVGRPAQRVGNIDAAEFPGRAAGGIEAEHRAGRLAGRAVYRARPEAAGGVGAAVVEARRRGNAVERRDQLRPRVHEFETVEAVLHRQHDAAHRAQRQRGGPARHVPGVVVVRGRVIAMQFPAVDIEPVNEMITLVPHGGLADDRLGVDDATHLAHRPPPSGGSGNSFPSGTPTRPAFSSSATFMYSPIMEMRSTSCSSPSSARAASNTASLASWSRISETARSYTAVSSDGIASGRLPRRSASIVAAARPAFS